MAQRPALVWALGVAALALALHALPGFARVPVVQGLRLSAQSSEVTLLLSFDKTAAGIILMAYLRANAARSGGLPGWSAVTAARAAGCAVVTTLLTLGLAVAIGMTAVDFKWNTVVATLALANLPTACLAEEAFFRGLVQQPLTARWGATTSGRAAALLFSAALFALAHLGAPPAFLALAFIAGIGNGVAYLLTGRVEAAILSHWMLNTVHIVAFSYPSAA